MEEFNINKKIQEIIRGEKRLDLEGDLDYPIDNSIFQGEGNILLQNKNSIYEIITQGKDPRITSLIVYNGQKSSFRPAILDPLVKNHNTIQEAVNFHYSLFNYILKKEKEKEPFNL